MTMNLLNSYHRKLRTKSGHTAHLQRTIPHGYWELRFSFHISGIGHAGKCLWYDSAGRYTNAHAAADGVRCTCMDLEEVPEAPASEPKPDTLRGKRADFIIEDELAAKPAVFLSVHGAEIPLDDWRGTIKLSGSLPGIQVKFNDWRS